MTRVRRIVAPTVVAVVLALGVATLLAQPVILKATQLQKDTVKFMVDHKLTLVKAIEAAEQETKGQALNATAQMEGNDVIVNVSCLVGDSVKHVMVDVKTGKIKEVAIQTPAPAPTHPKPKLPSAKP